MELVLVIEIVTVLVRSGSITVAIAIAIAIAGGRLFPWRRGGRTPSPRVRRRKASYAEQQPR